MNELKRPTTYEEQIKILQERGCIITNKDECRKALETINYYRLTAYLLPFKNADSTYNNITFSKIYRIYEFDRKLRNIFLRPLEEIEIFMRTKLAYFHAHEYGALGYLKSENFSTKHNAEKFIENFEREIENNKKSLFVKHHIENYGRKFPIWVAMEIFTFGMTARFYGDLKTADQKALATSIYNTIPKNIESWLRCCTDLRNICAHFDRLYFRIFTAVPAGINLPNNAKHRLWGCVLALKSLYPDIKKWNSEVVPAIESLIEEYREDISLYHIAFPKDWCIQIKK